MVHCCVQVPEQYQSTFLCTMIIMNECLLRHPCMSSRIHLCALCTHLNYWYAVCAYLSVSACTDAGSQPLRSRRRLNSKQIMGLDDGEDIYRALQQVADPLSFQVRMCLFTMIVQSLHSVLLHHCLLDIFV